MFNGRKRIGLGSIINLPGFEGDILGGENMACGEWGR